MDDAQACARLVLDIDRQGRPARWTKSGQLPASDRPPGQAGAPELAERPDFSIEFNASYEQEEPNSYLKEKGQQRQAGTDLMFSTPARHQEIAEAIQQMWKTNLGVDVKLVNQEWKVHMSVQGSQGDPQDRRMGRRMDYPDADNWDREVAAFEVLRT